MARRPPTQPTAPGRPGAAIGTAPTVPDDEGLARARPALPSLDVDVAQARVAAALFGVADAVTIGRYRIIERAGAGGMGVVWSAWDPELGRAVALKLASSGDAAARQRARDEGRALARLSDPNVVPIYDVFEVDDRVYLVMELVKGQTLRAAAATMSPLALVRAYRQAASGLHAAHAAGLIHRDFKPDNAILGADGRVRVLDFGLAHAVTEADGESPTIAGTPRYMAPEQQAGAALTPAVDQYALCVALRESLGPVVPRWLQPILARGTAERAEDRYPSMVELSLDLSLDPATRWRRRLAVGAVGLAAAGAVGGFFLGNARTSAPVCTGGPAALTATWGPARRTEIAARLMALASPFAAESAPLALAKIDRYRDDWITLHRSSCLASHKSELSSEQFDRRTACLDRRRASLGAIADRAAATTDAELPGLIEAADQLPDVATCGDDAALMAVVEPPPAARKDEVARVDALLAQVDVARDAGRLDDARAGATAVVSAAQQLGYLPLVARALLARGRVSLAGMTEDRGATDFTAALRDALLTGDEEIAVESFARRVWAVGTSPNTPATTDPASGLELVEAIADRLGDRLDFARALLDHNLGTVALVRGDRASAVDHFTRARGRAASVRGAGALELTVIDEGLLHVTADPAQRRALGRELIANLTRQVGANHPRTLRARIVVATIADDTPEASADLDQACRQMIRFHPSQGATIGSCGYELLWAATVKGDRSQVAIANAVVAARDHGADAVSQRLAAAYSSLVHGDLATAETALRELGSRDSTTWWDRFYVADGVAASAFVLDARGLRRPAQAQRAIALGRYQALTANVPEPVLARRLRALAALGP